MFEKPYVERLAEVFDKMPVDHDRSDQKASNLDGTFTVNSTHNANSPKVTTDRKECGLTTTIREKKIKKNARYTAGRISGSRPSRTPKEAVIALPPFSFRKNGNACPNTGAMSTGIKSSE